MAHSFITNRDRLLSDIITGILPKSDAVDILVGYFYFSGYNPSCRKARRQASPYFGRS